MTVYVDDYKVAYRGMRMSHMLSDESIEELHDFALRVWSDINPKKVRSWFQCGSSPHYDVSLTYRRRALELGAVSLPIRGSDGCINKEWLRVVRKARTLYDS